jgi:hypothetical protein
MVSLLFQRCDPDEDGDDKVVYKPNIYIYPTEQLQLTVKLDFPMGGKVITSIPDYGTGWNVLADTTGLIDNTYSYLFYESTQPDVWQRTEGWVIKTVELESFFRRNMSEYGFEGREIDDFVEYWIPRLNDYAFYSIYPQTKRIIDNVIQLNFSEQPEMVLRLFYVIKGDNQLQENVVEPAISVFERRGFFVTEWGVILN